MATRATPIPTAKGTDLIQLLINDKEWKLPDDKCLLAEGTWLEGGEGNGGSQQVSGKRKYRIRAETCSEAEKILLIMSLTGDKKTAPELNKRIQQIKSSLDQGGGVRGKPAVKVGETRWFSVNAKNGTVVIPLKVFFPAGTPDGSFDGKVQVSFQSDNILIHKPVPK